MTPQEADRQIQYLLSTPFHQLTLYERQNHGELLVAAQKVISGASGEGDHMTTAIGTFDLSGDDLTSANRMMQINDTSLVDAKARLEQAKLMGDKVLAAHLEGAIKDVESRQGPDAARIEKHFKDSAEAHLKTIVADAKGMNDRNEQWRQTQIQHYIDLGWSKDDATRMATTPGSLPA